MKRLLTPAVIAFSFIAVTSFFFVNGCKKDNNVDTETTSATDDNICEGEFLRVLPTVNKIAIDESGVHRHASGNAVTSSCPTISVDTPNQFPLTMTVDYGIGCTDPVDGKTRAGKLLCSMTESWDSIGCVTTISLDSFYVNGIHFEGTMTLTRTGTNSFHKVVSNGKCTGASTTNPWMILFDSDHDITFTSGSNSSTQTQIITITGSNRGTDRKGRTWTSNITSPIVRDLSCSWITKGTIDLTPDGKATRTVDFGDGTCDDKGTITIDGNTFEFRMQ